MVIRYAATHTNNHFGFETARAFWLSPTIRFVDVSRCGDRLEWDNSRASSIEVVRELLRERPGGQKGRAPRALGSHFNLETRPIQRDVCLGRNIVSGHLYPNANRDPTVLERIAKRSRSSGTVADLYESRILRNEHWCYC